MRDNSLTPLGHILKSLYVTKNYKGGFIWRWWNPIAWPLAVLAVIASVLIYGVPRTIKDFPELGFGIPKFYKERPEYLIWL